jgi:hypothetical protein
MRRSGGGSSEITTRRAQATMVLACRIAAVLLIVGTAVADAAPLVPPSDQPGRERYRFTPSPLDRFFESRPPAKPLLRWECDRRRAGHAQSRPRRNRGC